MSMTVSELEVLIGEAYALEEAIDKIKRDGLRPLTEKLDQVDAKILQELALADVSSFKSKWGTVIRQNRYSVQTPKTPEQKQALFTWLKSKGDATYWQYVSVNSQSLNALYKAELEIAKEEGNIGFSLPGVGEPTAVPTLAKRRR